MGYANYPNAAQMVETSKGIYKANASVTSIQFVTNSSQTFTGGTYYIWGA